MSVKCNIYLQQTHINELYTRIRLFGGRMNECVHVCLPAQGINGTLGLRAHHY